jgi:hypothetical protein
MYKVHLAFVVRRKTAFYSDAMKKPDDQMRED